MKLSSSWETTESNKFDFLLASVGGGTVVLGARTGIASFGNCFFFP
jgi:hypothetical protein